MQLASRFREFIHRRVHEVVPEVESFQGFKNISSIEYEKSDFETSIVQLNALGLIVQNVKNRSVKDRGTYWTLSPYGVSVMNSLELFVKKTSNRANTYGKTTWITGSGLVIKHSDCLSLHCILRDRFRFKIQSLLFIALLRSRASQISLD